jgi:hypothetical protein
VIGSNTFDIRPQIETNQRGIGVETLSGEPYFDVDIKPGVKVDVAEYALEYS